MSTALVTKASESTVIQRIAEMLDGDMRSVISVYAEALGMKNANPADPHVIGIIKKAALWGEQMGMVPGLHLTTMPFGEKDEEKATKYSLVDMYNYWKECLDIYNRVNRARYTVIYKDATPDEIKREYESMSKNWDKYTYDPRDPGMYAALVSLDDIKELMALRDLGVEPFTWKFGTYRHHKYSYSDKKTGKLVVVAENLSATETARSSAERRAAKKAIKSIVPAYRISDDPLRYIANHLQVVESERSLLPTVGHDAPLLSGGGADDEMIFAQPRGAAHVQIAAVEEASPQPAQPEREIVTLLRTAIAAVKGAGKAAETHVAAALASKNVASIDDLSDGDLQQWLAYLETKADTQPG
jgi:hypothetical protein